MSGLKLHLDKVSEVINHQSTLAGKEASPSLRSARIYKLVRWCLAPAMFSHALRTTPTGDIEEHARRYDKEVLKVTMDLLGVPEHHPHTNTSTPGGRLVMDRVHLWAGGGGLGVTSAAITAQDARLGNLLLTAHLVAHALGEDFDPTTQGQLALPDLIPLLTHKDTKGLSNVPHLDGLTVAPEQAYLAPYPEMSSHLSAARRDARQLAVLNQLTDAEAKAWLLSCGGEGANYLMAEEGALALGVHPLSNEHFKALGRARVGQQPTPYTGAEPLENPAHANKRWGDNCTKEGCGKPDSACGLHPLVCLEKGDNGLSGLRSTRHGKVKRAIQRAMRRIAGTGEVPDVEPDLRTIWREKATYLARHPPPPPLPPPPPGYLPQQDPEATVDDNWCSDPNKPRGDIVWKTPQGTVIYDLVITHPLPPATQQCHRGHGCGYRSQQGSQRQDEKLRTSL